MKQYLIYLTLLLFACNNFEQQQNEVLDISEISLGDSIRPTVKLKFDHTDSSLGQSPANFLPPQDDPRVVPFYYTRPFINNE